MIEHGAQLGERIKTDNRGAVTVYDDQGRVVKRLQCWTKREALELARVLRREGQYRIKPHAVRKGKGWFVEYAEL